MTFTGKNKKYRALLEKARELFWKHGVRRVSVEEICREAGVSKMTFYRYFPNKIELAKAVFDEAVEEGLRSYKEIFDDRSTTPAEKMKALLRLKLEGTNDVSREFLMDFYSNPELGLKDYIEEKTRSVWIEVLEYFREAQRTGVMRSDFKPELILFLGHKMKEMITDENLLGLYGSPQELVMELTNFTIYGIVPRDAYRI